MKKCNDCGIEMIEDCIISGQHTTYQGINGYSNILVSYISEKKELEQYSQYKIKARMCPKCGKIELYADIDN